MPIYPPIPIKARLRTDGTVVVNQADPGDGAGVLAVADATTTPTTNPDGTHTVDGLSTNPGGIIYAVGGRLHYRSRAGITDELAVPLRRRMMYAYTNPNQTSVAQAGFAATPTLSSGTGITVANADDADGPLIGYTSDTTNRTMGWVSSNFSGYAQAQWAPLFYARVKTDPSAVTSVRYYIGLASSDLSSLSADPTTQHAAAFRYDTGLDGTAFWRSVTCDGTAAEVQATTQAIAVDTAYHLVVEVNAARTAVRFLINDVLLTTHTTRVPGASTGLGYFVRLVNLGAARAIKVGRVTITMN
ncbi:hypothetical protein [Frankia sp. Cj3]|uniref:hypothetical protein n=1 Tax=Frankia sp. Cj3 TaxID=2880976 RepID=UPI001EF4FD59|nr:hypothetical protein [Frankia sp. Cj3]